jgi:DNA polymerase I
MTCTNMIIDGSNIEHRSFWASKQPNNEMDYSSDVNKCTKQFMLSFKKYVKRLEPDNIYVCWDKRLTWPSRNFREELSDDSYKGTREKSPDIHLMYEQEPKTINLLKALGCKCLFPNILEGDDVISWLVHTLDGTNVIVSVDNDLYQLIDDCTSMFHPGTSKIITHLNFEEEIGIERKYFKLYKAIKGDISDNIQGLPGYGEKKSKRLAMSWKDSIVTDEYKQIVEKSLKMIDLSIGYTMHSDEVPAYIKQLDEQKNQKTDFKKFEELCNEYGLYSFIKGIGEWKTIFGESSLVSALNDYFNNK